MKTSKSPDSANVTPSKKSLKQARLPFKLISEVPSSPPAPQPRKRKLSVPNGEPVTKVGRVTKENEISEDLVVISDDESKDSIKLQNGNKQPNPFVKLVDTALKRKSHKTTPKRSSRSRSKHEEDTGKASPVDTNLDKTTSDSPSTPKQTRSSSVTSIAKASPTNTKLEKSISDSPATPKQTRSASVTSSAGDSSLNESALANLTPKQLRKKLESVKRKEERDKEKFDRDLKKQQEKEERAKQRSEKEEQRRKEREEKEEARKRDKEEKDEQKRKEKEEKERQREAEKKLKELKEEQRRKEREEKEEQKRKEKEARDEERRKKHEALELEKQEQELKKKKAAEAFANFFVPKQKIGTDKTSENTGPVSQSSVLSSFAIKSDMRLAPTVRHNLSEDQKQFLEKAILEQKISKDELYLKNLKDGTHKPLASNKTWPLEDKDDDVMIVEDELPPLDGGEVITCDAAVREKLQPKLLSFHANRRPPYWGTWRKKSQFVTPRRPFGLDKQLDYEVDSDEDWEDEAEGESIGGSVAGSSDGENDEYELDNEVFVPHGYLSDEEATMDDDDVLSLTPDAQKARLKHLEDEFELELKKPTEKLKPRVYGILWAGKDNEKPENCIDALWDYFGKFSIISNDLTPLLQPAKEADEESKKKKRKIITEGDENSPKAEKKKKPKPENKETKKSKDTKKKDEPKKNQPGINLFLKKLNTST